MANANNTISMKTLKKSATEKYGSLFIPLDDDGDITVELLPAMQLSKEGRDALNAIAAPVDEETGEVVAGFDVTDIYREWVRVVARDEDQAELLIEEAGDNLAVWKEIQDAWNERTQPGEASPSRN